LNSAHQHGTLIMSKINSYWKEYNIVSDVMFIFN